MNSMNEEAVVLKKNDTWDLVPLLEGYKPIGWKWVFKKKIGLKGGVKKHMTWLVLKGYS